MRRITLEQACEAIVDCEHKTAPISEDGNHFAVGTPAMKANTIDYTEARRISKETFEAWTRRLSPRHGDLLFAREAPVGPIVQIPPTENVAPGQRTVLMRPDPNLADSRYLYYLLSSPKQQTLLHANAAGSTVAHLNVADVRAFEVELPSLLEQRSIAEILGALDDKLAANTEIAETSSQLAGLIYDRFVAEVPTKRMSEKLVPILGGTPARSRTEYWDGDCLWASAKDVTGAPFGVIADTVEKISTVAVSGTKAKPLPEGSVILTARGTVGAVARLSRASSFNQSCYGFAPHGLPAGILFHAVLRATQRAKAIAHGSVFDTITKKTFGHLTVPDLSQDALSSLESRIAPLLETVDRIVQQNATLADTRDGLLPHLLSGEICIKDAENTVTAALRKWPPTNCPPKQTVGRNRRGRLS